MIAVIDYNAGNTASVCNALERIGQKFVVTSNPSEILSADKVIFPGVGNAKSAMKDLCAKGLDNVIRKIEAPFLGICLGLQLLARFSMEGDTDCLGIIDNDVKKFNADLKVPQIGWNKVMQCRSNGLFIGIPDESYFYFVNSYYLPVIKETEGKSIYGVSFSSVVRKNNFWATQFHPEKSGEVGLKLLSNFCELC
jgi:imidazole glycerol-phosphate synthase subunit HisH